MNITDRINECIKETAAERGIDENLVTWHDVAILLAVKLNNLQNNN